MTATTEASFIH